MIPPAFIQDLLSRVDIVDLVGRHVQLKKGGANLSGLCPFHAEKSPSFTVSPSKQFYHCFGCGANGDAIRFLTEYSGMTFIDAVKDLAQQVGLQVPEEDSSPAEREQAAAQKQRRSTLTEVLAKAAEAYRRQLKQSPRAVDYLKGRGLSGEIAAQFGLGYAPEGWRSLASVFPSYDDPLLEESGMVIAKDGEDGSTDEADRKRYDRFRDRIMFPIRSVQGDVIGFGGRLLDRGEPKYLNSPETPVFSKGRELYGLFEGRAAIRQRGYALVVEGYMDVVALAQSGFGNAVATLGTACTPDHLQKLFRFTESVVFSFDGDKAGRRAAGRALEASLPHASDTRTIRFLFLPAEHDPDSYVREFGAAAFEQCVAQAVPLSRQLIEAAGEGCDLATAEGRAHMLANAKPLWSALPDGTLKRQLLADIAAAARDDVDQLLRQWGHTPSRLAPRDGANAWRAPARRTGRVSKGAANLLDRAIWLLLHRSELWAHLDG
ncbi:MAG: DNA primase, partial [Pseudomonadota bacterium]